MASLPILERIGALRGLPRGAVLEFVALLAAEPSSGVKMTYEQFLDWADEDTLAEWVDGRVVMTSPASSRHQKLVLFLGEVLDTFVTMHGLGTVYPAPSQMKLATRGREPDLLFVATEHLDRLKPTYLDGPADLVVEIGSPESCARDRGEKFYEYREAGIPEYWLIDPDLEDVEFYQLDARGRYQLVPVDGNGVYRSRILPGFWLRRDWLWQQPTVPPTRALLEIDRAAYIQFLEQQIRETEVDVSE